MALNVDLTTEEITEGRFLLQNKLPGALEMAKQKANEPFDYSLHGGSFVTLDRLDALIVVERGGVWGVMVMLRNVPEGYGNAVHTTSDPPIRSRDEAMAMADGILLWCVRAALVEREVPAKPMFAYYGVEFLLDQEFVHLFKFLGSAKIRNIETLRNDLDRMKELFFPDGVSLEAFNNLELSNKKNVQIVFHIAASVGIIHHPPLSLVE